MLSSYAQCPFLRVSHTYGTILRKEAEEDSMLGRSECLLRLEGRYHYPLHFASLEAFSPTDILSVSHMPFMYAFPLYIVSIYIYTIVHNVRASWCATYGPGDGPHSFPDTNQGQFVGRADTASGQPLSVLPCPMMRHSSIGPPRTPCSAPPFQIVFYNTLWAHSMMTLYTRVFLDALAVNP